jgi:hypothetical protein
VKLVSPRKAEEAAKEPEPDIATIINAIMGTKRGGGDRKPAHIVLLMGSFPILQTASNLPQLPISIQSTLPHVNLRLGTKESGFNPCISAIVDTGAALCCGHSGYIMAIAKACPELVKSIIFSKGSLLSCCP